MEPAGGHPEIVVAGLLLAIAALVPVASVLRVPYPILLVIGGLGIGLVPGVPEVALDPELVLLIFLPPLLYYAAFVTPLREFRANLRPIALLAVGLVLATCVVVAVVAHTVIDGMSWPAAFVLGAIVSPTDPVAATAIAGRLGVPRRVVTILEGESLINDATALVAYKVAVAAVTTGAFSLLDAGWEFVTGAAGGLVIGLVAGYCVAFVRRRLDDPPVEIVISMLTAYVAYLPAEELGLSGVVAAVTVGLYMGVQTPRVTTATVRMYTTPIWEILSFLLNSALFLLIGLQLPQVLDAAERQRLDVLGYAAIVGATVVLVRLVWTYVFTYVPRMLSRRFRTRNPAPPLNQITFVGWTGMRGAVSLAVALALPFELRGGAPFEERPVILAVTFGVVLFTLVLQGLTLAPAIRLLRIQPEDRSDEDSRARVRAAEAALARIDGLAAEEWARDDSLERARGVFEYRRARFSSRLDADGDGSYEERTAGWLRIQCHLLSAQREEIDRLRREGEVSDEVARRVTRDLDLEEARLMS